MQNILDDG